MKIYHSYWEYGWNSFDERLYNMHRLSVLCALKNYGNITLITTEKGKKILGDPRKHFNQVFTKQQERFNIKFEAFTLLSIEDQKQLYLKPTKPQISSNTDKIALQQAYYNSCFNTFKNQSIEDLQSIKGNTLDNLNDVEKKALADSINLKENEKNIQ